MKKTIGFIVYHRVDYDGLFSAAIIQDYLERELGYEKVLTKGWNYGDSIPELPKIGKDELCHIFLVDISFPPEDMKRLKELSGGYRAIWIDHHIGAIDTAKEHSYDDMDGLRMIGLGACELCWKFMYGVDSIVPKAVRLVSAYDVWDKSRFSWDKETLAFQLGLRTKYGMVLNSINQVFDKLRIDNSPLTAEILETGKQITVYNQKRHKAAVKSHAFSVVVGGKYKGICMLTQEFGSQQFESVYGDYDITVCVNLRHDENGGLYYSISMYSETETGLNLADYMKQNYNGGGHKCAAGGTMTRDQFLSLLDNQVV